MSDYRRIALWVVALIVPGGVALLPFLLADARKQLAASKAATRVPGEGPKAPNDGPGSTPASPDDGHPPRLAA